MRDYSTRPYVLGGLGMALLVWGSTWGLFFAPREAYMGDVQRIMYVHVPTAWNAMLALTFAFACALFFLLRGGWQWDARLETAIEVGVVLSTLLCLQGAIWAKPTWGVWWDWDPRLTTVAVLLFAFGGILALRQFVDDPVKRAVWSAAGLIEFRARLAALRREGELAPPPPAEAEAARAAPARAAGGTP